MLRSGKEFYDDFNSANAGLVNEFWDNELMDTNYLRPVEELKDFPIVEDFLLWMRQTYFQSVTKNRFPDDTFAAIHQTYHCSDTPSQINQDCSSGHSKGLQFPSLDQMNSYHRNSTIFKDANTYWKGSDESEMYVAPEFQQMSRYSKSDQVTALLSLENQCMLKDGLQREMVNNIGFEPIKENRKLMPVQNVGEVTLEDIVEKPYNLSKNPVDIQDSVSSDVEENLKYFAPYEDYETDFEEVDENSILSKHLRDYRIELEGKGLKSDHVAVRKSGFVSNKRNPYDQLQLTGETSRCFAEKVRFNDWRHVYQTKNEYDDGEDEEEIDNNLKNDTELFLDDTFEQDEALDYSLKSRSDSLLKIDGNSEKGETDIAFESKKPTGSESEELPPYIEDGRTGTYIYVLDSMACNDSLNGNSSTQNELISCSSRNENLKRNSSMQKELVSCSSSIESLKRNSSMQMELVSCSSRNKSLKGNSSMQKELVSCSSRNESLKGNSSTQKELVSCSSRNESLKGNSSKQKELVSCSSRNESLKRNSSTQKELVSCSSRNESLKRNFSMQNELASYSSRNKSFKGNSSMQKELVSCSSKNNTSCSGIVKVANSSKTSIYSTMNNAGLVNSICELGLFFPVAQNKVMSLDEENCSGAYEFGKKARLCTELFRLFTTDVQSTIIERDDVAKIAKTHKDNTPTRKNNRLEEIVDSMITDILGIS